MTPIVLLAGVALHAAGVLRRYEIDAPELHDPHRAVRVYTPAQYDDPGAATRRYPVVFLLHGWPGSDGNWPGLGRAVVTADSLIAGGRMPPAILVFTILTVYLLGTIQWYFVGGAAGALLQRFCDGLKSPDDEEDSWF